MRTSRIWQRAKKAAAPLIVCSGFLLVAQPRQAEAVVVLFVPKVKLSSLTAVKICNFFISNKKFCKAIGLIVDPSGTDVTGLHQELTYDPTKFVFDPSLSGPLCGFAANGTPCPPVSASLGTFLIPEDDTPPGTPPSGATLTYPGSPGDLILNYTVPAPVDLSTDKNVFELTFDLVTPVPADTPLAATYFGTPGTHQFNQISFTCNPGATPPVGCTGSPPISGVDIGIPEPASLGLLGIGLIGFGAAVLHRRVSTRGKIRPL